MLRPRFKRALLWVSLGLLLGLATGLAVHVGLESRQSTGDSGFPLEELKLRASATHGSETFAMATGPSDEDGEAVMMLDYLTGDLTCFVLNPRLGKFNAMFRTNIWKEMPPEKGKKATYVMCTGNWNPLKSGAEGLRPADCILYVADCNTGNFAAYSFPWSVNANKNVGPPMNGAMVTLDIGKARDLKLRK
ncbi:MAG: hypothetical protein K8R36_10715 [Planctomycetales bacterium]|nr:hypothetical protein [Planctomycetales bacterium]